MTGIYPAPILDKAGETQVNNISIVIRRNNGWQHIKIWATRRSIVALALFQLGEYTMQGLAWAIDVIVQQVMLCEAGKAESKHQSQICCFQERERPVCST